MSTIILLDVSLSMCRPARRNVRGEQIDPRGDQPTEIRQLANAGIGSLLDYLAQNVQLERVALVVFSSLWEIKQEFTRHHESVKNKLYDLELYDKSNIVNAVRGIHSLIPKDYANSEIVNIILVTDGQLHHENLLSNLFYKDDQTDDEKSNDEFHDIPLSYLENQFDFPCKIQIVCLSPELDSPMLKHDIKFYKKLVKLIDSSTNDCPVINSTTTTKNIAQSAIWFPKQDSNTDITIEGVEQLFLKIAEHHYEPYRATLACGNLYSRVLLSPKPSDFTVRPLKNDFDDLKSYNESDNTAQTYVNATNRALIYELSEEINIIGFLQITEIGSPAVTSRHIVMPILHDKFNELSKAEQILTQDPNAYSANLLQAYNPIAGPVQVDAPKSSINLSTSTSTTTTTTTVKTDSNTTKVAKSRAQNASSTSDSSTGNNKTDQDITKQPSFCALLLTALKQENMVAICEVGKNVATNGSWYGMLHPQTDSKKRTTLMLSLFIPSDKPILWLPSFKTMGSASLNADLPQSIRDKMNATAPSNKPTKSYSSNNVLWLDPESVQADLQKVVRHARRSVDKVAYFYKELNRIRKAAISYGFYDVLFGLAAILEREKNVMLLDPNRAANQAMIHHISNAVESLRAPLDENSYNNNIGPIT